MKSPANSGLYQRIYRLVKQIPPGQVASYGQIATMIDHCGPRQVGYAMAATPKGQGIPWHRVINAQGKVSVRKHASEDPRQITLLKTEGVLFSANGVICFDKFGWDGPECQWLKDHDYKVHRLD